MVNAGASRDRLARVLGAAFADGLLSEQTLSYRLGLLFGPRLVDPVGVVGDLWIRDGRRRRRPPVKLAAAAAILRRFIGWPERRGESGSLVLGLDWSGGDEHLVIGRHDSCDVIFENDSVSRRHARLLLRDGGWMIEDLASLNGTNVNGMTVGRCQLQPGDDVWLGDQRIEID
jgi:FHA domain